MWKKTCSIMVGILLSLVLAVPALAADCGKIYDETGVLASVAYILNEDVGVSTQGAKDDKETDSSGLLQRNDGRWSYVFDTAELMSEKEQSKLENMAQKLREKYDFGVYLVTVDDFRDYSDEDVFHAALNIYNGNGFGVGAEKDGLLLLLSMKERDFNLMTNGKTGNYAFNDAGREAMTEFFLDDFGEDQWYDGFAEYINWADDYLEKASEGRPYTAENGPWDPFARNFSIIVLLLLIICVPLIPAYLCRYCLVKKMESVAKKTSAGAYIARNLYLTKKEDNYIRTSTSRRYNPRTEESGDDNGGGVSHSHSGSASGTSGKF